MIFILILKPILIKFQILCNDDDDDDDKDSVGLFADGAAVRQVGDETFRLCQLAVDEMVTVSTDDICAAIKANL